MPIYVDKNGYKRHSNLVHRQKAYEQIYKRNRKKYPLPFSEYVIHHKDGNKLNNNLDNLEILLPKEHEAIHGFYSLNSEDQEVFEMVGIEKAKISNIPHIDKDYTSAFISKNSYRNDILSFFKHPVANFFIFHLVSLIIIFAIIVLFFSWAITDMQGGNFTLNDYFNFISGFLSYGWWSLITIIIGYLFLAIWWTEKIRQRFFD